ncbi:hypothetical protein O0L34_g10454 [Tuta absoluta]|nr:hypothetical protein O0L34_g10454 [Tuta absoluta]
MPQRSKVKPRSRKRSSSWDCESTNGTKRWRPWRPQEDGQVDDQQESEKFESGESLPCILSAVTAKADIIPIFDPEKNDLESAQWLNKIEQLGAIHNWSDKMKSYFMQARLSGMAKVWHSSLHNYEFTWNQWKKQLLDAFPQRFDFVESLRDMLNKRKAPAENMTQYFYSKIAMLNKLEITGAKAVACIIDGLPPFMKAPARAGNYSTPSELYSKFLTVMSDNKPRLHPVVSSFQSKVREENSDLLPIKDQKKPFVCFLCNEAGHSVRRCPKNSVLAKPCCSHCGKSGHPPEKCWFKPSGSTSTAAPAGTSAKPETVHVINEVNDIYFKPVVINNVPVTAYFDNGAKVNVMNLNFFKTLDLPMDCCEVAVGGLTGSPILAKGSIKTEISINGNKFETTFIIIDCNMGKMNVIIGQPVINNPAFSFKIWGNIFDIQKEGDVLTSQPEAENNKVRITCSDETVIPPNHVMLVEVSSEAKCTQSIFVDACRRVYKERDFSIPASIINGDVCLIGIRNESLKPLYISKGELLTRGLICEEVQLKGASKQDKSVVETVMTQLIHR